MKRVIRGCLGFGFTLSTVALAVLTGIEELGFLTGTALAATILTL